MIERLICDDCLPLCIRASQWFRQGTTAGCGGHCDRCNTSSIIVWCRLNNIKSDPSPDPDPSPDSSPDPDPSPDANAIPDAGPDSSGETSLSKDLRVGVGVGVALVVTREGSMPVCSNRERQLTQSPARSTTLSLSLLSSSISTSLSLSSSSLS